MHQNHAQGSLSINFRLPKENEFSEMEESNASSRQEMDEDDMNINDLEPVKLDDVLVNLRNADNDNGEGNGQHRLNVKGLVLSCVHAALSMVKDKAENANKETDRVGLVLTLLPQEQVEGIFKFILVFKQVFFCPC